MPAARARAQAKINVYLRIIGRRPDGFHNLDTVFQRIDLADEVTVRTRDDARRFIDCAGPRMPAAGLGPAAQNLAFRAAEAYAERTGWPRGFEIEVTKHVPVGGGLGGGSADAGAVLRILNALAPAPIDDVELGVLGLALGSDIPFLALEHACALGSERGGSLGVGPALPPADLVLFIPPFGIATKDAYRWLVESANYDIPSPSPPAGRSQWTALDLGNTFERVVEPRFPAIKRARERLRAAGATIARLSGSGSAVFGLFDPSAPTGIALGLDGDVIATQTSSRVVQVEVLE